MTLTEKINKHLFERVQNCELKESDLISIIDNIGSLLNAKTISDYAKCEKITYNGALQRIKTGKINMFELFGVKFIIDTQ